MRRASDPLYWAAMQVHRRLSCGSVAGQDDAGQWVAYLAERQRSIARVWDRVTTAHARGWHLAAGRLRERLFCEARRLEGGVAELLKCEGDPARGATHAEPLSSPATILAELRQVGREFEEFEVKPPEQVLVARTGPITLEDVSLGPFAIELHLDRLAGRRTPDAGCFDCVALESNPAASDDAVTYPHVKGKTLCAGDATVPLTAALRAGRLADAFLLVRGVLQHYNPASAYVSLRDWGGSSCGEWGRSVGPDDTFYCEQCHRDVCDVCFQCCDVCGRGLCRGCLDADNVSDLLCCQACRHECRGCQRIVDRKSFDADSGLCPECLALAEEQTTTSEEDPDDGDDPEPEAAGQTAGPAGESKITDPAAAPAQPA